MRKYTKAEIDALKTPNGGYDRATLKMLGVSWPPMKGWKRALLEGRDPNAPKPRKLIPMSEHVATYETNSDPV